MEERCLQGRDDLGDYLTWPSVQQVMQRTCERTILKTGSVTQATSYALTSLAAADASAAELAAWWRGHWAIENKVHYVRDVTLGEDAQQMYSDHAPHVLATLRNTLLNLVRAAGWTNVAAALRHYSASLIDTLALLGLATSGL